jgi:hypothetical protein
VCGGHSAPNSRHISIFTGRVPFIYIVIRAMWSTMLGAFFVGVVGVCLGCICGGLGCCF